MTQLLNQNRVTLCSITLPSGNNDTNHLGQVSQWASSYLRWRVDTSQKAQAYHHLNFDEYDDGCSNADTPSDYNVSVPATAGSCNESALA